MTMRAPRLAGERAFRALVVDDEWDTSLKGSQLPWLSRIINELLGTEVTYALQVDDRIDVLSASTVTNVTLDVGWIRPDFARTLEYDRQTDGCLRWSYGNDGRPLGTTIEDSLTIQRTGIQVPAPGFWLRASPNSISPKHRGLLLQSAAEPVELFVVRAWPLDKLHDLIGARDGWLRFWNLLVIDNLIHKNKVYDCLAALDGRPLEDDVMLFDSLRFPVDSEDADPNWLPDRRTQLIVEASRVSSSFSDSDDERRRVWPRFQFRKDSLGAAIEAPDAPSPSIQEFTKPPAGPTNQSWSRVQAALVSLQQSVNRWHEPRIYNLSDRTGAVERIAATDNPVFLLGRPGTGKSFIARAIHDMSARGARPFVVANCAAIPREGNFFESTVFGRERDATGQQCDAQLGYVQEAHGGTLFLDEVHHLAEPHQAALLRLVQDCAYRPLGAELDFRANIRLIVGSNYPDLPKWAQKDKGMRLDLFQRLSYHLIEFKALPEYEASEFGLVCRSVFGEVKKEFQGVPSSGRPASAPATARRETREPRETLEAKVRRHLLDPDHLTPMVDFDVHPVSALLSLDPSALFLLEVLELPADTIATLYSAVKGQWHDLFANGGNIRLLRQLLSKAVLFALGRSELRMRDIERAFETVQYVVAVDSEYVSAVTALFAHRGPNDPASQSAARAEMIRNVVGVLRGTDRGKEQRPLSKYLKTPQKIFVGLRIPPPDAKLWEGVMTWAFLRYCFEEGISEWNDPRRTKLSSDGQFVGPLLQRSLASMGFSLQRSSDAKNRQGSFPEMVKAIANPSEIPETHPRIEERSVWETALIAVHNGPASQPRSS